MSLLWPILRVRPHVPIFFFLLPIFNEQKSVVCMHLQFILCTATTQPEAIILLINFQHEVPMSQRLCSCHKRRPILFTIQCLPYSSVQELINCMMVLKHGFFMLHFSFPYLFRLLYIISSDVLYIRTYMMWNFLC